MIKYFTGLIILLVVIAWIVQVTHPVLLKWLFGNARVIGKPVNATVYTNGEINNSIKVYRDKTHETGQGANDFILSLSQFDKFGTLKYINISLDDKGIGRPVSTNIEDYDVINRSLFQSDVGCHFADFRDDIKGFNFDPKLKITSQEITFNVPPKVLRFDSVRIELN